MSSAANLGGIFIILDETALAVAPFAQITNERDRTLGDRLDNVTVQRRQWAKPVCLLSVVL